MQQWGNGYDKKIFLACACFFIFISIGHLHIGTILTPYAQSLGATWFVVGVLSASMYVIRILFGTSIGRLADQKGILAILQYSLMLYPAISGSIFQCCVCALAALLGKEKGMGETMGFLSTANSAGMILGSLILGALPVNVCGYEIIFLAAGMIGLGIEGVIIGSVIVEKNGGVQYERNY